MTETIPFEAIDLTPLDHIIPLCYVRFFLSFSLSDVASATAQLQDGMTTLISELPFLQGVVAPCDRPGARKGLLQIQPSRQDIAGQGVLTVKHHDTTLQKSNSTASSTEQVGVADESCLPLPVFPEIGKPAPIFRLQVNALEDGIILGFAFHHGAFDASGVGVVIQELARCCRPPRDVIKPGLLSKLDQQKAARENVLGCRALPDKRKDHSTEFPIVPSLQADLGNILSILLKTASVVSTRYFRLPAHKVNDLKQICNQILPMLLDIQQEWKGETLWLSSNDIVVSLLWMCMNRTRHSHKISENPPPKSSEICMSVNVRGRVKPPILPTYMGNMVVFLRENIDMTVFLQDLDETVNLSKSTSEEPGGDQETPLQVKSWQVALCRIALNIRKKLNGLDDEYARSVISYLDEVPDLSTVTVGLSDFHISSWRDLGVYEADFGDAVGHPSDMRIPDGVVDGQFYIMPKRLGKDAEWEAHVTIHQDLMEQLRSDELWASYTLE